MNAARLRNRITIQHYTDTQDDFGQPIQAWVTVATLWAEVRDLSGREWLAAQQVASEVTTRVRIRHREGIDPTMRILYGTRTLNIQAVLDPDGKRTDLHLMCKEVR